MTDVLAKFYPESQICGISRIDHRVVFFNQVNGLLRPDMRVLDFGAGRGKWAETESGHKLALTTLKGKCREVVGADVDDAVLENQLTDSNVIIDAASPLPFEDESFDVILSWATFEHIERAELVSSELTRVLKPGGWICAWTPSKWAYFAIAARLIPDRYQSHFVKWTAAGARKEKDVFPTYYRLNTIKELRQHFPQFEDYSYYWNGPPAYHAGSVALAWTWKAWMSLLPRQFSQSIHVFMRKRAG